MPESPIVKGSEVKFTKLDGQVVKATVVAEPSIRERVVRVEGNDEIVKDVYLTLSIPGLGTRGGVSEGPGRGQWSR